MPDTSAPNTTGGATRRGALDYAGPELGGGGPIGATARTVAATARRLWRSRRARAVALVTIALLVVAVVVGHVSNTMSLAACERDVATMLARDVARGRPF